MDFKTELTKNKTEYLDKLTKILSINSIYDESTISEKTPFGKGINDCLEFFLQMAKNDGFTCVNDDGYAGHIEYGGNNNLVGILCHLDVVPVGDDWDSDPFMPVIKDNKIIARGAMDDKGPTMAAYFALKMIKDANIPLKNKIRLIVGTDEETGWRGINHYFEKYEMPAFGISPDADFPLIYGEKGMVHGFLEGETLNNDEVIYIKGGSRFNIVIDKATAKTRNDHREAFNEYLTKYHLEGSSKISDGGVVYEIIGLASHAMEPFKGVNAGLHMANFLSDYTKNGLIKMAKDYFYNDCYLDSFNMHVVDNEMGTVTINNGIIDISNENSKLAIDIRYPNGFSYDEFIKVLTIAGLKYNVKLKDFNNRKPHYVNPNDKLVTGLYDIYVKHTGDSIHKPYTIGGGTYARALPKGVAFGMEMPDMETVAHQKNEWMSLDAFYQAILIYADAIIFLGELDA